MYNGPVGPTTQIHDYNVHIDRYNVFWMIPVRHDAVIVDFDNARARLKVTRLSVFDDHDIAHSKVVDVEAHGRAEIVTPTTPPILLE